MTEQKTDLHKYYKPRSVTWWVGIASMVAGGLHALPLEYFDWSVLKAFDLWLDDAFGFQTSFYVMFGAGLIGLRGALK